MVIIRRELPRTGLADLAPHNVLEGSPPLAGSAADSFTPVVLLRYAARFALNVCSVSFPMAHTKPTSSRARAAMTFGLGLLLLSSAQ